MRIRTWEDKSGAIRANMEVMAEKVQFLSGKNDQRQVDNSDNGLVGDGVEDELPF